MAFFQTTAPMLLVGFGLIVFQAKAFEAESKGSPLNPRAYTSPTEVLYLGSLAAPLFVGTSVGEVMALRALYTGEPSHVAARWVLFGLGVQAYCLITPALLGFLDALRSVDEPSARTRPVRLAALLLAISMILTVAVLFTV